MFQGYNTADTVVSDIRLVAVIDIGATSIRMAVAEIRGEGTDSEIRTLDSLVQPVNLGREVFETQKLSRASIELAATVLRRYQRVLLEYGIKSADDIRVVATNAVREASNRLAFIDRIHVATGLHVVTIDEAEVNRITYMGIIPHLQANDELHSNRALVVEVGGGSTEMLVMRNGNVLDSESYRLGSIRLLHSLDSARKGRNKWRLVLESHIRRFLNRIGEQIHVDEDTNLVGLGGDMRFAAHQLLDNWDGRSLARIPLDQLERLTEDLLKLDQDGIVRRYGINFVEAETLAPALLAQTLLAKHFGQDSVYVCDANLRDGLLHDMAVGGIWTAEFRKQIVRQAVSLGRQYAFDEDHAVNVAEHCKRLYQQLVDEHLLDSRHEVILYVAALLHEIGAFVNIRSNHKHALYLIRNSELFGLSRLELLLVGLVARYHRRAYPQNSHDSYRNLHRDDRVAVSKMAAILRIAIALDDTRTGRINDFKCVRESKKLVIMVPGIDDVSLEQISLKQNSGLFQDVFGIPVLLRPGR